MEHVLTSKGGRRNPSPVSLQFAGLAGLGAGKPPVATALRSTRQFFGNQFVYAVISQRAGGFSLGINLSPDRYCNFDCAYCEVERPEPQNSSEVDLEILSAELGKMLALVGKGKIRELPGYQAVPEELLNLKGVALSGDGEPTLCPNFDEAVQVVVHTRAQGVFPFFKIVLITNATGLHLPQVQLGLQLFTAQDEIWAKLDAGTQAYMDEVNRPKTSEVSCPSVCLDLVMENILRQARQRPVVIQSLFALIDGKEPPRDEIEQYVHRLRELKEEGANISQVQIYSAHRPAVSQNIGHLPLKILSRIAQRVRDVTGLSAEVF